MHKLHVLFLEEEVPKIGEKFKHCNLTLTQIQQMMHLILMIYDPLTYKYHITLFKRYRYKLYVRIIITHQATFH